MENGPAAAEGSWPMIPLKKAMARVKVYLPTYRRHEMLPRAIESLLNQTFTDWECEVHNDDPEDPFPGELVEKARDPRIRIVNHPKNLGGAATMNAFYAPAKEEFVSILEDDNWWEPEFLEEMVRAAESYPHVSVFWSNMRIWQEQADGSFIFMGKETYPEKTGKIYEEFWWPDEKQILGAIHSNGACLIKSCPPRDYRIPDCPQALIENFRERKFPQPLLLVRKPLANFSRTKSTGRSVSDKNWGEASAVLAAVFFKEARWSDQRMKEIIEKGRCTSPPQTNALLNSAIVEPKCRSFLKFTNPWEKIRWVLGNLKRPRTLIALLRSKKEHPEWWRFLEKHTSERFAEARKRSEIK